MNKYLLLICLSFGHCSLSQAESVRVVTEYLAPYQIENSDGSLGGFMTEVVTEMFKFEGEDMVEVLGDQMMFKPLFFKALTENPFKLDERMYPVDFGTPFEIKNRIGISIPEGFEIVSVPETLAIGLPEDLGVYKFVVKQQGNSIMITTIMQVNTSVYPAYQYEYLKEFYNAIVNKCAESVVIKKGALIK